MHIPKNDLQISLFYWPEKGNDLASIDPIEIMKDFFDNFHFDDVHALLWDIFKFLLQHDGKNKESLIHFHLHFYERMCDLVTASYLIAKEEHLSKDAKILTP